MITYKKIFLTLLIIMFSLLLTSCKRSVVLEDNYNNETIKTINITKDEFKIMQLTDLHFSYSFDYLDKKTYQMLDYLIELESPDLIVITGDLFMSILAKPILKKFIKVMEGYKIPWTITFGNHEREYHDISVIVNILLTSKTNYLYFHYGPKLSDDNTHGASNFKIKITKDEVNFLSVYLLDSKNMRTDGIKDKDFFYDYLSYSQVEWFNEEIREEEVKNVVFMHMPLMQFLLYDGDDIKEKMWPQGKDTGLFDVMVNEGKTLGVFVGHDHNNEFSFYLDNILLAYGRNSGYNAYGTSIKGARIIKINEHYNLESYLVGDKDE